MPGGERNWDYRYCWLRDATFTLLALMHAGYREEAQAWGAWLRRSVAGTPSQIQTLYGLAGERWLMEWEVPWLARLRRRAAGAHRQRGERAVAARCLRRADGCAVSGAAPRPGAAERELGHPARSSSRIWRRSGTEPDESIWEVRGGAAAFHLLQGDGLGGVGPRDPRRREIRHAGQARAVARAAAADPRFGLPRRLQRGEEQFRAVPMAATRWTPACCCCRWWASCRRRIRASRARSPRSSAS